MNKDDLEVNEEARQEAFNEGLLEMLKYSSQIRRNDYCIIVNMREPSHRKRLYVYDMVNYKFVRNHHVSHGKKSSDPKNRDYAISFSNEVGSNKSSLGAIVTTNVYQGKHGKSLRLQGLDQGLNDNIYKRAIVIHPADYVTDRYILDNGRAGQSEGCLAVDPAISSSLIDLVKEGVFIYVYY